MTDAGMLPFTGIEFVVGRAFSAVLAMGTVYQHRENSSGISEKRPLLPLFERFRTGRGIGSLKRQVRRDGEAIMHTAHNKEPDLSVHHSQTCSPMMDLRQYTLYPGTRDAFVELFDRQFVETQEAVGMRIIGQFRDIGDPNRFVWMRGFQDMRRAKKRSRNFICTGRHGRRTLKPLDR
jgi:hypothetical protein